MSSISFLGSQLLALALPTAFLSFLFYLVGVQRSNTRLMLAAQRATFVVFALLSLCVFLLICAFIKPDYSILYVASYSSRALPLFYKITGLWAGLDGSILFWTWLVSLYSLIVLLQTRRKYADWLPWVNATMMVILIFFILLMVFANNPFTPLTGEVPADGKGLNPLLQNIAMVFHPPALYLGYTGFSVPFAFVIAALVTRRLDATWIEVTRSWTLVAWSFLTLGLILGGAWAYVELGWGGFWAWDPVENAALMPWLTATAYIHSVMIQKRRGMLLHWNVSLIILTFVLTIFGTYLTRSGVVQSVHAFSEGEIGPYFLFFLLASLVIGFGLMISRREDLKSRHLFESWFSKEMAFLVNNVALVVICLIVIWGTMFPTLTEFFTKDRIAVGPAFFNKTVAPLGVVLLFLMGVGPLISWRRANFKRVLTQFRGALFCFFIVAAALYWSGFTEWFTWLCGGLIAFVLWTIILEFYSGMKVCRIQKKADWLSCFFETLFGSNRRFGGYIVHIGFLVVYLGIIGCAYKSEADFILKAGETYSFKNYSLEYVAPESGSDQHKEWQSVLMRIYKDKQLIGEIKPSKNFYFASEQPSTEVAILHEAFLDVYLILGALDLQTTRADFRVMLNPLISYVWIGGIIMLAGIILVVLPKGRKKVLPIVVAFLLAGLPLFPSPSLAAEVHDHNEENHKHDEEDPAGAEVDPLLIYDQSHPDIGRLKNLGEKYFCLCGDCVRTDLRVCKCGFSQKERAAIFAMIQKGFDDNQIEQTLLDQYGPKIYAYPPDKGFFAKSYQGVWLIGGLSLLVGFFVLRQLIKKSAVNKVAVSPTTEDEYRKKLLRELEDY